MSLGDTLVELRYYKVGEGLKLLSDAKFNAIANLFGGFKNTEWIIPVGSKAYLFAGLETEICYGRFSDQTNPDTEWVLLCKKKGEEELFARACPPANIASCHTGLDDYQLNNQAKYVIKNIPTNDSNNFRQEFIYNGKIDNSLKFVYREYYNDMQRFAFSQEVQYDLNESNIVGFKELRLEVLEASNQSIKYRVLKNFDHKKMQSKYE